MCACVPPVLSLTFKKFRGSRRGEIECSFTHALGFGNQIQKFQVFFSTAIREGVSVLSACSRDGRALGLMGGGILRSQRAHAGRGPAGSCSAQLQRREEAAQRPACLSTNRAQRARRCRKGDCYPRMVCASAKPPWAPEAGDPNPRCCIVAYCRR